MSRDDYGHLARWLHHAALGFAPVAEASFSLEQLVGRPDSVAIVDRPHVFIAGLARAGTTILMRRLYQTGVYRSLTYRDMPFVLMPGLWRRISFASRLSTEAKERAHGDGILVDLDSPEALEEVFWRVFEGERYLRPDRLLPHDVGDETIERFRFYVAAILDSAGDSRQDRYLSKNNNSILRLRGIRRAFPNSVIVVPFRHPLQHAMSLLLQHEHFVERNRADPFSAKYMNWLAHHEFGQGQRPFVFVTEDWDRLSRYTTSELEYWLTLWSNTYRYLLESGPNGFRFLGYETLCRSTDAVWSALLHEAKLERGDQDLAPLRLSERAPPYDVSEELLGDCMELYMQLQEREESWLDANGN